MRAFKLITMSPFSFFSSVHISDRITSFREAERHLFEFAKTRFNTHHDTNNLSQEEEESNHHFELFDTPIKVPSVIKEGCAAASCQVHDNEDAESYSLHGVKVVNKRLTSSIDPTTKKQPAPLVLLHGYANGSLYFYRNLMGLSHHFESVYALDMLGWGLSSRPKFELLSAHADTNKNSDDDDDEIKLPSSSSLETKQKVSSAESFFVESLESWRQHHNLPKLTLAGHSMGGYLSVAYAERYPQHVEKLILLSPVGVPEKQPEDDESKIKSLPFYVRGMIKTSRYLFNRGITPGSFLRSLPFSRSKAMVDGYILNRLPAITCPEERTHLGEYLYQNSMLPGSGECCLNEILTAGAFAKIPLVNRIPNIVKTGADDDNEDGKEEEGMEVHMIYGQNDWMDFRGGLETQRVCHEKRLEWEQQQQQKGQGVNHEKKQGQHQQKEQQSMQLLPNNNNNNSPPPRVFVHGVRDASHLLMLDNYQEFNAALIIASGGEEKLPPNAPRPVEFVCDEEVARSIATSSSSGTRSRSRRNVVVGEEGATEFFRGPRWNRRTKQQEEAQETEGLEEKKVEEQELA